jgi:asparagine synthase (glutamine-hydrolysing)
MCGICGFVNLDGSPADKIIVRQMADTIRHRGPDDEGYYVDGPVALGARRLSIIDLEGGHQPITNEDESVWIVFNGELYNFAELRSQLQDRGHTFRTGADTEVVLHAYEEWGSGALERFNGMFAFAIWDGARRRLLLARDHAGIKPLYYGRMGTTFLFGSELKALLRHPAATRSVDVSALDQYLTYMYVPTPASIVQGISKLPPGHTLTWEDGRTTLRRYWDHVLHHPDRAPISEKQASRLVLDAVTESVHKELVSDVPVGVLLSGGIDSSAVAALMSRQMGTQLDSFSIAFDDPSFDESGFARRVADQLGTNHHELTVAAPMMLEVVPRILDILDEPMADASVIPSYVLAGFAREHVKVTLGGDGGDELFAGYSTMQAHRLTEYYRRLPGSIRRSVIPMLVNRLPVSHDNLSFDYKAKRFVAAAEMPLAIRHHRWLGCFFEEEKQQLLMPEIREQLHSTSAFAILDEHLRHADGNDPLDQILYLDMKMYMEGDILVKVDRASMGNSLESRVPLLNRSLIDTVQQLPIDLKLRRFTRKYIFRKAMQGILPNDIINRPKKGFGIPMARWLNGELRPLLEDQLDEGRIRRDGFFHYPYVRALIDDHRSERRDNRMQLWTLILFQLWHERYLATGGNAVTERAAS